MEQAKLTLRFDSGRSTIARTVVINLDPEIASKMEHIVPLVGEFPNAVSRHIETMRRRNLFLRECRKLGALLADRLANDESHIEPAQKALKSEGKRRIDTY